MFRLCIDLRILISLSRFSSSLAVSFCRETALIAIGMRDFWKGGNVMSVVKVGRQGRGSYECARMSSGDGFRRKETWSARNQRSIPRYPVLTDLYPL